jgi:hypothetical protein
LLKATPLKVASSFRPERADAFFFAFASERTRRLV